MMIRIILLTTLTFCNVHLVFSKHHYYRSKPNMRKIVLTAGLDGKATAIPLLFKVLGVPISLGGGLHGGTDLVLTIGQDKKTVSLVSSELSTKSTSIENSLLSQTSTGNSLFSSSPLLGLLSGGSALSALSSLAPLLLSGSSPLSSITSLFSSSKSENNEYTETYTTDSTEKTAQTINADSNLKSIKSEVNANQYDTNVNTYSSNKNSQTQEYAYTPSKEMNDQSIDKTSNQYSEQDSYPINPLIKSTYGDYPNLYDPAQVPYLPNQLSYNSDQYTNQSSIDKTSYQYSEQDSYPINPIYRTYNNYPNVYEPAQIPYLPNQLSYPDPNLSSPNSYSYPGNPYMFISGQYPYASTRSAVAQLKSKKRHR